MTTSRELRQIAARMLHFEKNELVTAGVIKTDADAEWQRFQDEPLRFICKLGDAQRDILATMVSQ
jgi:hypothetical protein